MADSVEEQKNQVISFSADKVYQLIELSIVTCTHARLFSKIWTETH